MTQQFRFCGNPFRGDTYRGCDFGCKYCYANSRHDGLDEFYLSRAKPEDLVRMFHNAFETNLKGSNATYEMMRYRVPLHIGGMSDPFQRSEFKYGNTKLLIELSNKYQYPMMFSTKCAHLPDEYWEILDPNLHAFQVSLIGMDKDFIKKFETNTPAPEDRVSFCKKLHERGFWVSARIQPLIDLEQAKKVVLALNDTVDFFTVEHLKIPNNNVRVRSLFEPIDKERYYFTQGFGSLYELKKEYKIENIEALKAISKKPIGVGDNDIHYMSDSRNCCGLDTVGRAFDHWLKYNLTYFCTGECTQEEKDSLWAPEQSVKNCFMSNAIKSYGCEKFKDFVDKYCERNPWLLEKD